VQFPTVFSDFAGTAGGTAQFRVKGFLVTQIDYRAIAQE
jgi:hypothetical protein